MRRNEVSIFAVIIGILFLPVAVIFELAKEPKYGGRGRRRRY